MLFDRLYGKITFPKTIKALLTCPGLLRLREIRLGNVPFLAFPSFAGCTRYEHSIGVCYLAELAAKNLNLELREKIELMIACLYHDVATPPFAHAVEDVLKKKFGFAHEQHLYDLLTGRSDDLGRERAQVFQGRGLKLRKVSQTKVARELGLDLFEIADIAIGKGKLGSLIKSTVDLDNIDNVIRAASAVGIREATNRVAELLASSFILCNNEILLSEDAREYLEKWQQIRYELYSLIYSDIKDFSFETMIKHAIEILIESSPENGGLRQEDWCLTENELIHNRLMRNPKTREIVIRMRFADTYPCLGMFSYATPDPNRIIDKVIPKLENDLKEFFKVNTILNFSMDRRWRTRRSLDLHRPLTIFTSTRTFRKEEPIPSVIVGIFTPERISKIKRFLENVSFLDFKELIISSMPSDTKVRFLKFVKSRSQRDNSWESLTL